MRRKIVAGNWKMNLLKKEAWELLQASELLQNRTEEVEVVLFPPSVFLDALQSQKLGKLKIGAQNFYPEPKGAYTGEISLDQLKSIGINLVLIGHSERRSMFNQSNEFLKKKVNAAIEKGMQIFFCCGEPEEIRKAQKQNEFVQKQLEESLFQIPKEHLDKIVIAYEPVWAIGTGLTASTQEAHEMHAFIRKLVAEHYGEQEARDIRIIYGGSCNEKNAEELFSDEEIDGGLIGGASLDKEKFGLIIQAAQ
jgi:triosephosphate isomerase